MEKPKQKTEKKNIFASHLKLVVIFYIMSFGAVYFVYMLSPKYYRAGAAILQPPERDLRIEVGTSGLTDKFVPQLRTNTDLFFSILTSRTMKDGIINRFNLIKEYNVKNIDRAREFFDKRAEVYLDKQKVIRISVIDTDPVRAADMANYFIEKLDSSIKELAITTAKQDRMFIEKRLEETENEISRIEKQLADIKNHNNLVADKELAQVAQTAGGLMEKLFEKKLELQSKSEVLRAESFEIQMLGKDIANIEEALSGLLAAESDLMKILRELKAQEEVYSLLTSNLEEAKINEARDTPVLQVLDSAVVPRAIHSPDIKMLLIIQAAIFGGIGLLIFFFDLLKYLGSI